MIVIGSNIVPFKYFYKIDSFKDIASTPPNSTIYFKFNAELMKYCFKNSLSYAIYARSQKDAIYAESLNAKYIVSSGDMVLKLQKVAEHYMFDAKIILLIDSEEEIEEAINKRIDGVIFKSAIKEGL